MSTPGEKFQQLVDIMARLRGPNGCPWDREQTFDTIKPYTLEETYEVLDAIDRRDWQELAEELGDFLLQAVFFAQMAAEENLFDIGHSLDAINQKLVRRHPHVFGDRKVKDAAEVIKNWEEIKKKEGKKNTWMPGIEVIGQCVQFFRKPVQVNGKGLGVEAVSRDEMPDGPGSHPFQ